MFLDSDDEYDEFCVETLYNEIIDSNNDIICCNALILMDGENYPQFNSSEEKTEFNPLMSPELFDKSVWGKLYSKNFIIKNNIQFPDYCLFEDVCFIANISIHSPKVLNLNNYYGTIYHYSNDEEYKSISHTMSYHNLIKIFEGLKLEFSLFDDVDYDLSSRFLSRDLQIFLSNFIKTVGENNYNDPEFLILFEDLRTLELESNFNIKPILLWAKIINNLILNHHVRLCFLYCKILTWILNSNLLYKLYLKKSIN